MKLVVTTSTVITKVIENDKDKKANIFILLLMLCKMLEQQRKAHNLMQFGIRQKVKK